MQFHIMLHNIYPNTKTLMFWGMEKCSQDHPTELSRSELERISFWELHSQCRKGLKPGLARGWGRISKSGAQTIQYTLGPQRVYC